MANDPNDRAVSRAQQVSDRARTTIRGADQARRHAETLQSRAEDLRRQLDDAESAI